MREASSRNIKGSALKSICFFRESVTYIHRSTFAVIQFCNLSKHVICEKLLFLHSLDVLIKMFANSLAVLNQQTLGRADHVHCFQTQLTESCLGFGSAQTRDSSVIFLLKPACIPRLGSGLMLSGIDLKFTLYSKIFLSL